MPSKSKPRVSTGRKLIRFLRHALAHVFARYRWKIVGVLAASTAILLAAGFLANNRVLPLADRLAVLSSVSTVVLVLITAIYVGITARTLEHLREERLGSAEPLLYLTLRAGHFKTEGELEFSIESFGKGPVIG